MGNAEEFSGQRTGLARSRPAKRAPVAGHGRIRYAHGGPPPPTWAGELAAAGAWPGEPPVGGRHGDLWVLVGGGIATAAAFAAAFVAAGGIASHPAPAPASRPAVISQACPAPAASPTPSLRSHAAGRGR